MFAFRYDVTENPNCVSDIVRLGGNAFVIQLLLAELSLVSVLACKIVNFTLSSKKELYQQLGGFELIGDQLWVQEGKWDGCFEPVR